MKRLKKPTAAEVKQLRADFWAARGTVTKAAAIRTKLVAALVARGEA